MLLAGSANSDWYLGLTIGFVLVVVVVVVVAIILTYASRIADSALVANAGLEEVRDGTAPLWEVRKTNGAAIAILEATRTARAAVVATVTGTAPVPPAPSHPEPLRREPAPPEPSEPEPPRPEPRGVAPASPASPSAAEPAAVPDPESDPYPPQGGPDQVASNPAGAVEPDSSPQVRRLRRRRALINRGWRE